MRGMNGKGGKWTFTMKKKEKTIYAFVKNTKFVRKKSLLSGGRSLPFEEGGVRVCHDGRTTEVSIRNRRRGWDYLEGEEGEGYSY